MAEHQPAEAVDPWAGAGPTEAVAQIARLVEMKCAPIDLSVAADGRAFEASREGEPRGGILAVRGNLVDETTLLLKLELVRAQGDVRASARALFAHLASLNEKCRIAEPVVDRASGETSLWVAMRIHASPMSLAREGVFLSELERLAEMARALQDELPAADPGADLAALYAMVSDYLEPIHPWQPAGSPGEAALTEWARETVDFLRGSASVAVASRFPVVRDFALAQLAAAARGFALSLGRLLSPTIPAKGLNELARKAPGIVVVPAISLSLSTSPYELGNETQALLSALSTAGRPALFVGSLDELQAVFSGGQGGSNDPLRPILRSVPDVDPSALVRFAVHAAGREAGGLPVAVEDELTRDTLGALASLGAASQPRVLPMLAARAVRTWAKGAAGHQPPSAAYARGVGALTETLAGLSARPRAERSPDVEARFTQAFTDPALLDHLRDQLLAQDAALEQLAERLVAECLTRPAHQPYRYCAQGTPGTGKSESAVLLAARLGIPYINIDAASMPDYYSAAAQLLGSGRGIVGSYQSGRLEQAAKHHRGALVEVSDLDHAVPQVRSALADLFLQVLETGEGQSATGALFSCANLILAFTMNLPGGMDEKIRRRIGFDSVPARSEIALEAEAEIKRMLSGAFLSRVGRPILFDPLDGPALALIVERAIAAAVRTAAARSDVEIAGVAIEPGVGASVVAATDANTTSFGARVLLERGRALAAEALLALLRSHAGGVSGRVLRVAASPNGKLAIRPE